MTPLLSVVIPTFSRAMLLGRAITSALNASPDGNVEVVVVPNGPDTSWKTAAEKLGGDARIHWHPLAIGNACAARNHGLAQARGKYVRLLDDDDYLYRTAADQLELIEAKGAVGCSAPLENVLPDGRRGHVFCLPASDDYPTVALLSIGISGLTQGSVFRTSAVQDVKWREDVVLYDDYLWMLDLAEGGELVWVQSSAPVGAYVQHDSARLSRTRRSSYNSRPLVASILKLHDRLSATARMTPERICAVATALLTHAHSAFPSSPLFLGRTIRQAHDIAPHALPLQAIFRDQPWLARYLLATEWAMVAPRYLTRGYRRASWFLKDQLSQAHV